MTTTRGGGIKNGYPQGGYPLEEAKVIFILLSFLLLFFLIFDISNYFVFVYAYCADEIAA